QGQPEAYDDQIGLQTPEFPAHTPPVEGIDGIDPGKNGQSLRRRFGGILSRPGKEKIRVLQGERINAAIKALLYKLSGQPLIERGQPPAQRMRRPYDDDGGVH